MLVKVDSASAKKISPNDTKRVIRALEIFNLSGKTKEELAAQNAKAISDKYEILQIVLEEDRNTLYKKIDARVDSMITSGLEQEVRALQKYKKTQALKAIGYSHFIDYFDNKYTLAECIDKIKQHSRNYAKRQLTYFKNMTSPNKQFFNVNNVDVIKKVAVEFFDK